MNIPRVCTWWLATAVLGLGPGACNTFIQDSGWERQPCNFDAQCNRDQGLVCAGHRCSHATDCSVDPDVCAFFDNQEVLGDTAWCNDKGACDYQERMSFEIDLNDPCILDSACEGHMVCAAFLGDKRREICTFRCLDYTQCPDVTNPDDSIQELQCVWSPNGSVCADPSWVSNYGRQCSPDDQVACSENGLECLTYQWPAQVANSYCLKKCSVENDCSLGVCCQSIAPNGYTGICSPTSECPS